MKPLTVFLDANVLFSAAWRPDSKLSRLWRLKNIRLITTAYAADEAERNLETNEQIIRLRRLMKNTGKVPAAVSDDPPEGINLPDKDIPILLAAAASGSDFLLTGDITHFGAYFGKTIQGVKIMIPGDLLREHDQES